MVTEAIYVMVVTTTKTAEDAQRIAESLVVQRLVACAQISGPIRSFYRWRGEFEKSREFRIVCKTRRERVHEVFAAIRKLHPYETPQLIAVPIIEGSDDYFQWIDDSLIR